MNWNTCNSVASRSLQGLLLSLILFTPTAQAATWVCGNGNWNWNGLPNLSCWDWWDYPDSGEEVWIVDTILYASKTVNYINPGYNPSLRGLYINSNSGTATTLHQSQDELTVTNVEVGSDGKGKFTQDGGKHNASYLYLGHLAGSNGTYNLSGTGALSTYKTYVGYAGTGKVVQAGVNSDHHVSNSLYLAHATGTHGQYDLDEGTLTTENAYIGYEGEGIFQQTGDSTNLVISDTLYLAYGSAAKGEYRMTGASGAQLTADRVYIGYDGEGIFEQANGTINISDTIFVASAGGSEGSYTLEGGSLSTPLLHVGSPAGGHGIFRLVDGLLSVVDENVTRFGIFKHTAGTHSVSGSLVIYDNGEYLLQGGVLNAAEEILSEIANPSSAVFTQTGGENNVSGNLYIGRGNTSGFGGGDYTLSSGSLVVGETEYIGMGNSGLFTQTSGTHLVKDLLRIGFFDSRGSFNMQGGTLVVEGSLLIGSKGNMKLSGGMIKAETVSFGDVKDFAFIGGKLAAFTISGNLENFKGTLAPGGSPGHLTIRGDYTQYSGGILEIELGGVSRGAEYDAVSVNGNLNLAGTLQVIWWDGFSAALGDSFDIMDWGAVSGNFDVVELPVLSPGLAWDTSSLYIDGTLLVSEDQTIFSDSFE